MPEAPTGLLGLVLGKNALTELDDAKVDYPSTIRRMSQLRSILQNKNIITYDVLRMNIAAGATKEISFNGNAIMILQGTGLELSFNDKEVYFPWDSGDPLDEFPFYKYKVKNTGITQDIIILSLLRGRT